MQLNRISAHSVLAITNLDLAALYLLQNGIEGAFAWKEDTRHYQVLEGKPEELTGFVAAEFALAREASAYADAINERIALINAQ